MTGKLVAWLAEKGDIGPEDTADALERTNDAARDLPRAERLRALLSLDGSREGDPAPPVLGLFEAVLVRHDRDPASAAAARQIRY